MAGKPGKSGRKPWVNEKDRRHRCTFKFPPQVMRLIKSQASKMGISQSNFIIKAIRFFLDNNK